MKKLSTILLLLSALFLISCAQSDLGKEAGASKEQAPVSKVDNTRPQAATGETCGGMMGTVCASAAEYCHMDISAQCGAADQTGTCKVKPEMCTQQFEPVCGCNGKTYGNECSANSKGISAAYDGPCRDDGIQR